MIILAVVAYVRNKQYVASCGSFSWHLKRVIVARFVLLCLFPAITYIIGFVSRYDNASSERRIYDRLASLLLSAMGGMNCLVFLGTEKALLALLRGKDSLPPSGFSGVVQGVERHSSAICIPGRDTGSQPLPESQQILFGSDAPSYETLQSTVVVATSLKSIQGAHSR
jgi:hypothetical protein